MSDEQPSSDYEKLADKVGLVPNVRKQDNLLQAAIVGVGTALGAGVGAALDRLLVGMLIGLVASGLLSGLVLMVMGLVRK